jgi:hypothetical protein
MSPGYWKRRRTKLLERSRLGVLARERKRLARAQEAREVGQVTFSGPMFGGEHVIRCLDAGNENRLLVEVDGQAHRPRSWRGLMRVVCKRIIGPSYAKALRGAGGSGER